MDWMVKTHTGIHVVSEIRGISVPRVRVNYIKIILFITITFPLQIQLKLDLANYIYIVLSLLNKIESQLLSNGMKRFYSN